MCNIEVIDQFRYHGSVVFGLEVAALREEWPLVVGCSLRTRHGDIVDQPARWLSSAGLALWEIKPGAEFKVGSHQEDGWTGQVIFALWPDDSFSHRLVDTGWIAWSAFWMIGTSTYGLDMQDQQILAKYGSRRDVWRKLDSELS